MQSYEIYMVLNYYALYNLSEKYVLQNSGENTKWKSECDNRGA